MTIFYKKALDSYEKKSTVRPWDARFLGNEETRAAQIRATLIT